MLKLVPWLNFDFLAFFAVDKFLFIAGVFFGRLAVLGKVFNNQVEAQAEMESDCQYNQRGKNLKAKRFFYVARFTLRKELEMKRLKC